MAKPNPPFMSGVPEFVVLRLLAQREMYGYELLKAIRLTSGEAFHLAEGVIYPIRHGLAERGALKAKEKTVSGRTRVYYRVTAKGSRRLDELSREWDRVSAGINSVMGESYA